jgi:hypothetical protein
MKKFENKTKIHPIEIAGKNAVNLYIWGKHGMVGLLYLASHLLAMAKNRMNIFAQFSSSKLGSL